MNPTPIPFENRHTRAAAEAEQQANVQVEQAGRWLTELAARKAEATAAEAKCVASAFASDDVAEFLAAQTQLRDTEAVASSVLNHGGPEQVRIRALTTPEIFDVLARGYGERIDAIEKLRPAARKALGIRYVELTNRGLSPGAILGDAIAGQLSAFDASLTVALASAVAGRTYCEARGVAVAGGPRSWASLYDTLVAPLPVPPVLPAAA